MRNLIGKLSKNQILKLAKSVLITEAEAVKNLEQSIGREFLLATQSILECKGKTIVSGVGKSGLVAKKIAATFSSTGTPSFFLHAGEASHGDIGSVDDRDVFLAISNSGESEELLSITSIIKRMKIPIISLTSNVNSSLAQLADIKLCAYFKKEACPLGLAPSTSSTVTIAMGDALAFCTLEARGFRKEDFARSHPAGKLGRRLSIRVSDIMREGAMIPIVKPSESVADAIIEMTKKGMGMTVVSEEGCVIGIFTDGDLRRVLQNNEASVRDLVSEVMTRHPKQISQAKLAVEALEIMEKEFITQLIVIDEQTNEIKGALNMHDLIAARVL